MYDSEKFLLDIFSRYLSARLWSSQERVFGFQLNREARCVHCLGRQLKVEILGLIVRSVARPLSPTGISGLVSGVVDNRTARSAKRWLALRISQPLDFAS